MIRKIRKFKRSLLNKNEDFQTRLIRIVLLLAFAASIIGMGRVVLGAALEVLYALIPLCIVSGIALYMADDRRKIKKAVRLLVFTSNLILFPLIFIMSGGVDSGTPVWFVLGLSYVFLLFDGRELVITFLMSAVAFLVSYGFAYRYPHIVPIGSRTYSFADSYITMVVVSCFIGLLMKIQARTYDEEQKLAEKQKEEIEQIARSKDAFFANMSHEIRTPINTIIGLNEMTLREDISDEDRKSVV